MTDNPGSNQDPSPQSDSPTNKPTGTRRNIVVGVAAIVVLAIVAVIVIMSRSGSDDAAEADGARRLAVESLGVEPSTSGRYLFRDRGTAVPISEATCDAIKSEIGADECLEGSFDDLVYFFTANYENQFQDIVARIYKIVDYGSGLEAQQVMAGDFGDFYRLNNSLVIQWNAFGTSSGGFFVTTREELIKDETTGNKVLYTVEVVALLEDSELDTVAVLQSEAIDVARDLNGVAVAVPLDDDGTTYTLSVITRRLSAWRAVEKTVSASELEDYLAGLETVLYRSSQNSRVTVG